MRDGNNGRGSGRIAWRAVLPIPPTTAAVPDGTADRAAATAASQPARRGVAVGTAGRGHGRAAGRAHSRCATATAATTTTAAAAVVAPSCGRSCCCLGPAAHFSHHVTAELEEAFVPRCCAVLRLRRAPLALLRPLLRLFFHVVFAARILPPLCLLEAFSLPPLCSLLAYCLFSRPLARASMHSLFPP